MLGRRFMTSLVISGFFCSLQACGAKAARKAETVEGISYSSAINDNKSGGAPSSAEATTESPTGAAESTAAGSSSGSGEPSGQPQSPPATTMSNPAAPAGATPTPAPTAASAKTMDAVFLGTCGGCHSGAGAGAQEVRFQNLKNIQDNASDALEALAEGKMPPNSPAFRTSATGMALRTWLQKGAPANEPAPL